jgi:Heparinase II/III-like protein
VWLPGIQVMAARVKEGSGQGLYLAAQGGHNAESHNHNDVGNFVVYLNGNPVLIDVGVESYTAKTFSSKRYDIWTMQSAFHNLPTINGVMQAAGRQYEARDVSFHAGDVAAEFSADLAAAYPKEAAVEKWRRSVRLDRAANAILVTDRFALRGASGKIEMSLMTPCTVRPDGARALILSGGMLGKANVRIAVEAPATPDFRTEEIVINDARLRGSWGNRLYRTVIGWPSLPSTGELKFEITSI